MQFISETIDTPIAGSLDTDFDQADVAMPFGRDLLHALRAMREGDFSVRMVGPHGGLSGQIAEAVNVIAEANQRMTQQLERIGGEVGRDGRIRQRIKLGLPGRGWSEMEDQLNRLLDSLFWPATEITRTLAAVAGGDLTQTIALDVGGSPLDGEFLQAATAVNAMIRQFGVITAEITRLAREVGTGGKVDMRVQVREAAGVWKDVVESVNALLHSVRGQIRNIADVTGAIGTRDLSAKMTIDARSEMLQLRETINAMVDQLRSFAAEINRVVNSIETVTEAEVLLKQFRQLACELQMRQVALQRTAAGLERRVAESAAELECSKSRLRDSEDSRILALAAGKMGSWDWDLVTGHCLWDAGQRQIFGADPASFDVALPRIRALVDRGDWKMLCRQLKRARQKGGAWQLEFRVRRPDGVRWCLGTAVAARDAAGRVSRIRGVTMDITERKEAEDRQLLLAREVDHRTKNALAVVHAIISLTRADGVEQFSASVEGRIHALARAHSLLSDSRWRGAKIADLIQGELASFRAASPERIRISGRSVALHPFAVQALALSLHELAANAARHGALSVTPPGSVRVAWEQHGDEIELWWVECGVLCLQPPAQEGLGMRIIRASVETQLCGSVEFDWKVDGLCCIIRVPCDPKTEQFGNFLYSIQNSNSSGRLLALS